MAWPSSSKASTANVDAGNDSISLARPDIKQNIDNVNAIIDEFDIASSSQGQTLRYNGSVWQPVFSGNVNVIEQNTAQSGFSGGQNDEEDYSGTFTLTGSGGVTASGNTITFPAGTYLIDSVGVQNITGTATDATDTVKIRLRTDDSAETLIAFAQSETTGFQSGPITIKFLFGFAEVHTFATETDVKLTFEVFESGANDVYTVNPIRVERIA